MHEKYLEFKQFIKSKSPGSEPLLIVIRGSQAYGTQLPTSDTDYAGVYIQPIEDILGFGYKEQINDDKNDTVFYEIKRFLELLASNNPTILELLNTPEDCVIYKHPDFRQILSYQDQFLTKICAKSFGGYAIQQIKKAKGQDKKQNWEKDKVTRKTPLDFCYIHVGEHSYNLREYLEKNKMSQEHCGLSKSPHGRDVYALFYTEEFAKFKGIAFEDSNDIRLSSIPKDLPEACFVGHISYNKDGYTSHCNDYKSYQTWLENKNEQRWVDVKAHGQKIDGKNMMHCRRLLEMAKEIAEGKGIIVRRQNAQELIAIRKGEVDLESLIQRAEHDIKEIDELFKNSNLPDSVDKDLVNSILVDIRKEFYNLK
jgi:predicted nucleotidyltransferase